LVWLVPLLCADVPGVTIGVVGISAVPFEHAVSGVPAVDGVLAVLASLLILMSLS